MQSPQVPTAPDPMKTAQAQSELNKNTALTQYQLNATNQKTPTGSLSYRQIGTWEDGTPRFEATTELSPEQQGIFNTTQQTQTNLANIGRDQSARIGQLLGTPFDINAGRARELADINQTFLDPQWARNEEAQRTKLANSGIRAGSAAYDNAMKTFSGSRQNAYNQMYLDAYGQANQAALTERNQPINEITALMSGSQVGMPNFQRTPNAGVAPVDYTGAVANNTANQWNAYNAQMNQNNAMMSGLFGLGKTALGGWL